jgi:hypothetical protein
MTQDLHPNLKQLSHSSRMTLHNCPRKYRLRKLIKAPPQVLTIDLLFGKAVGIGIQSLLLGETREQSIWKMFLGWESDLLHEGEDAAKKKKLFWYCIIALDTFRPLLSGPLKGWQVAVFNGVPASELGFEIAFANGFRERGFVDIVLYRQNAETDKIEFMILELKTTGAKYADEAMYGNSGQAIGYGVILDVISHGMGLPDASSYTVLYLPYLTTQQEWVPLPFKKLHQQRAQWIQEVLLDISMIEMYHAHNYWPMHGESCISFGRRCEFYGTCNMTERFLIGGNVEDVKEKVEEDTKYQFKFNVAQIIEAQLRGEG